MFRLMEGSVECASFCGATPVVLGDTLYVVGGFFRGQPIPRVLLFSPQTHTWSQGVPMATPRAYCKAGAAGGKLFVVGGVHRGGGASTFGIWGGVRPCEVGVGGPARHDLQDSPGTAPQASVSGCCC